MGAQGAYAAMLAIPIPERQLDALHRLLGHLCAAGDVGALVGLPLAGTLALGGGGNAPAVLSLADEAARFLQRRAANADLGARPQPYLVGFELFTEIQATGLSRYAWWYHGAAQCLSCVRLSDTSGWKNMPITEVP